MRLYTLVYKLPPTMNAARENRTIPPCLGIVVPCYNEAEVLPCTHGELMKVLDRLKSDGKVSEGSHILYVDDGSTDTTWEVIEALVANSGNAGIALSGNRGHQNALLAGMAECVGCDAVITIDADLQDDPAAIGSMVSDYMQGAEIVYGVRSDRSSDNTFKRLTARLHYRTMKALGVRTVYDHGDFRLMGRRALDALLDYGERNLYLRGIVAQLGFAQSAVHYRRHARRAGRSKYPLRRMAELAVDGVTSFSVRPVRLVFATGVVFFAVAMGIFVYVLWRHFSGHTIEGWTSLMLSVWFCSGVLLMALGVIGEYVGKIYTEVKHRPRSHCERRAGRRADARGGQKTK